MKTTHGISLCSLVLTALLTSSSLVLAQEPAGDKSTPASDNTKVNERDRDPAQPTADNQGSKLSDQQLTQQIRKSLIGDKSLSVYAHNVKIISQNGVVTLKGPVRSEEEKKMVEAKAAEVSRHEVKSELSVAPKN